MSDDLADYIDATSEAERVTLLVIGYSGEIKSTRLQKMSLIVKAALDGKVPKTHGAYLFGGYSDDVEEGAENMRSEGYVAYVSGKGYRLSEDGEEAFKLLCKKEPKMEKTVKQVTDMLKSLSDKQITAVTYKFFPELAENSIIKEEMERVGNNLNIQTFKLNNNK